MSEPEKDPEKEPEKEPEKNQEPNKGFTQDEVDAQIKKALEEQKAAHADKLKEFEAKQKQAIEEARQKGEERAKMTAKEKAEDDMKQRKSLLDKRESDLQSKIDSINQRDALSSTRSALDEKNIPNKFADFLTDVDKDNRSQNIEQFTQIYNEAIQKAVDDKLKGSHDPQTSSGHTDTTITKDDWSKMTYSQKAQIYNDDPELAKKLNSETSLF